MENILCNNCHSKNYTVRFEPNVAQIHKIVQCNDCDLMYAIPLEIDFREIFGEGDESAKIMSDTRTFSEKFIRIMDQKEKIQIQDYATSLTHVDTFAPNKGRALEIGCSHGYFLKELEDRGWEVYGIEPSVNRRREAKEIFNYDLTPEKLEDSHFPENYFDAIFMFHVIEHVLDPAKIISILHKYLKPGGIAVVETPSYDGLTYKLLKHRERSIQSNGHLFFFTKKTLREMFEKGGFITKRHDYVGRTLTLERLFWNISKILRIKFVENMLSKFVAIFKLDRVKLHINMKDMQRIYCKKEELID